eukprot:jgi/Orpsp1_1/1188480/evm.model.d7180000065170.1
MKIYLIFIILVLIICTKIKCEKGVEDIFDEFKNVSSQKLLMKSPSNYCRCHQRTIFFKYQNSTEDDYKNNNINEEDINNKEYFVGGIQKFSKNPYSNFTYECLRETLKNNNMIRLFNKDDSNLHWYNIANSKILKNFKKHQKYNHFIKYSELSRKDLLYSNYYHFKQKFPNDFTYMMETYTNQQMDQIKEKFKNYQRTENDLWLVKPKGLSRGRDIRFFESIKKITKKDIITKYISNPLLIEGKKFDLRIYLLVTGHNPLKVYIYKEGFARISTEEYNLDLNDLNNLYRHLTNVSINKKNKSKNNSYQPDSNIWSLEKVKEYIKEKYAVEFDDIWEKIEDIAIKSLITVTHKEIEKEKEFNLNSNNLFELYGIDIMIDSQLKPWLLEINLSPDLSIHGEYERQLKYKLISDILNIVGMVPYSHVNGQAMEGECDFENSEEEAIQQSICEFTRPLGEFKRIFPLKNNIENYKKYFENIIPNNQALWDELQTNDFE